MFNGLESSAGAGPNQDDNLLYAGRVAYNFLSVEKNPGYYTRGTYYGTGGDILTVAVAFQSREDGAGSFLNPGDYRNISADVRCALLASSVDLFWRFGGNNGLTDFKNILGFDLQADTARITLFVRSALALALAYAGCPALINSKFGRVLVAVRDAENRARFIGYKVVGLQAVGVHRVGGAGQHRGALYVGKGWFAVGR